MSAIRIVEGRPAVLRETTGERLRRLRMAKGWSQLELAINAGIADGNVSRIERDMHSPNVWVLAAIADALGVCVCFLWSGCEHDGEEGDPCLS